MRLLLRKDWPLGRFGQLFFVSALASALCLPISPCLPQDQAAPAAPAPSIADGQFRAGILRRHPNYNNFTLDDISTLNEAEVRGLLGFIGNKVNGYESLIPRSIVREFGADATAKFMQALAFDAARRGQPAIYALALLNGGLDDENDRSNGAAAVNSNVSVSLPLTNGARVQTTAPDALNYSIAATAIAATNARYTAETISMINGRPSTYQPTYEAIVRVPPAAVTAIVAANSGLPRNIANENFSVRVRDEVAFQAGYATEAGASRNISPISVDISTEDLCEAPIIRNNVYRAGNRDVDLGEAFHAGAAMRRYDAMTDAEFQSIRATCLH